MWFVWSNIDVCMLDIFYLAYWHLGFLFNIDDVAKLYCVKGPLGPFSSLCLHYTLFLMLTMTLSERDIYSNFQEVDSVLYYRIIGPRLAVFRRMFNMLLLSMSNWFENCNLKSQIFYCHFFLFYAIWLMVFTHIYQLGKNAQKKKIKCTVTITIIFLIRWYALNNPLSQ